MRAQPRRWKSANDEPSSNFSRGRRFHFCTNTFRKSINPYLSPPNSGCGLNNRASANFGWQVIYQKANYEFKTDLSRGQQLHLTKAYTNHGSTIQRGEFVVLHFTCLTDRSMSRSWLLFWRSSDSKFPPYSNWHFLFLVFLIMQSSIGIVRSS